MCGRGIYVCGVGCAGSKAFIIYLHVNDNSFGVEKRAAKRKRDGFSSV